jgi:putative glutamine amidotransferase
MTRIETGPPLIVVPADVRPGDGYVWHAAPETYLAALARSLGAIPLVLPSLAEAPDFDALLGRVDGVLLSGSRSNVHPTRYGTPATPKSEPHDPRRDAVTVPLIAATLRRGVPLFAICRGMQELNVSLGGTLIAEVREEPGRADHRAPVSDDADVRFAISHEVAIVPGGMLAGIVGADSIRVNSLHHQAIGRLADGLVVEATAPDGTIEAVSVRDAAGFALGVQWHPEYWVATDPPSAKLFAAFGEAVRRHRAASVGMIPASSG